MQQQRRTNPYPWTWEPAAAVGLTIALIGAAGVQGGRSLALVAAGHGWHWPPGDQLFRSLPGLFAGDPTAGLTSLSAANVSPVGLAAAIATVETVLAVAVILVGKWAWERWGTGRILGMATRTEAEETLGLTRLHQVRRIIRPDLFPKRQPTFRKVPRR